MKILRLIQCFFATISLLAAGALSVKADILTGPVTNTANGNIYYLLTSTNWTDSERQAVALGGHLATIRNTAEENWVYNTFNFYGNVVRNLWIGLYDPDPANNASGRTARRNEFKWISGEAVNYSHWSSVEPNNPDSIEASTPPTWEFYVHIWNRNDSNAGTWNNYFDTNIVLSVRINGVVEIVPMKLNIAALPPNRVVLNWPVWGGNYLLESSTNLGPVAVWQTVTNARATDGTNLIVTNQLDASGRFYRLRSP